MANDKFQINPQFPMFNPKVRNIEDLEFVIDLSFAIGHLKFDVNP
jgi:hypothetical protein